ncbi:D-alanyl-D-alanine carboxypeptidase precursor [Enhygromyxa salina]|uniref:D-alanyl-D-alanine carboxypeptidase n=1 Tax=Enhygromyxa salina TaxID=215803 RepID=A0A2S9Y7K9_9BACT|nr:serine hydrolase domain-containing protein [Enhygromyxa salina]PRQ01089.1 D-alanyl-D-alanine carboxypeptidase precursor [Enhygromyxa salina]
MSSSARARWSTPGRGVIATAVLIAGCYSGSRSQTETQPTKRETPGPASDATGPAEPTEPTDPKAADKRACVRDALVGAAPHVHGLIRSVCAEWIERDIPGVALAVAEPGVDPFHLELGVRCFSEAARVEPSTPFRFGSISKPVTAALALALVDEGRLSLTTTASAVVPGYESPSGRDPALAALLRHRSGLRDIAPEDLVELDGAWLPALGRSEVGRPGEYHYSNAGYSLIGAMVASAAARDYEALVAERVATPLGLSSFTAEAKRAEAAACGHLTHDEDRHPIPVREDLDFMPGDPRWMNPAGGVLGSAADLASFALAIGTERLPGSAAMLEPGAPLPPEQRSPTRADERYGYGLRSWALDADTRAYGHSGNNVAFAAELLFVPGRRAVVLLANCGAGLPASAAAAAQLLREPR